MIKNGTRLQSQVCDTQVIVVRSADSLDDLRAGGVPMVPIGTDVAGDATLDPEWGQIIVAVVVPAEGAAPDADELREHVRAHLRG